MAQKNNFLILIFMATLFLGMESGNAFEEKEYDLGGQKYSKSALISDFINISINEYGWLDDAPKFSGVAPVYKGELEFLKATQPFLHEFITRKNGYPVKGGIVKWDGPITVAIGWPFVTYDSFGGNKVKKSGSGMDPWGESQQPVPAIFKGQLRDLVEELNKLTGMSIKLIENDLSADFQSARIRIIPTRLHNARLNVENLDAYTIEPYIKAGVPFTPFELKQVDGYVLPNADNSIGYAVCRISPQLDQIFLRRTMAECLVRSLGLTMLSKQDADTVLGHWNNGHHKHPVDSNKLPDVATYRSFSEYDRFMISLLYCKEIKKGMIADQVRTVLNLSDDCFKSETLDKE